MPRRERNKFVKRNQVLELKIEDYAFGGKGIARIHSEEGSFVVFVPNTLPGQLVKAQIKKSSKKYAEAKLIDVLQTSKDEVEVPFQDIPGAPYIQLPIELQHQYKKESTLELFKRIGKVADIEDKFDEFISSPSVHHYRNKMEYGFSAIRYDHDLKTDVDEFSLGFKKRGTWWCGENLDKDSGLFDKQVEDNLKLIREFCEKSGLAPWHAPKREGFFRFLVVRKSFDSDELLFNLVTTSPDLPKFDMDGFVTLFKELFGDRLAGILHTINDEIGDRTLSSTGTSRLVYGKEKIVENLLGLNFEISMKSFFQTNPKSAEKLYSKVVDYVMERQDTVDGKVVMDLFCGTGTIGQIVASRSKDAQSSSLICTYSQEPPSNSCSLNYGKTQYNCKAAESECFPMYIELQVCTVTSHPGTRVYLALFQNFTGHLIVITKINKNHKFDRVNETLFLDKYKYTLYTYIFIFFILFSYEEDEASNC